MFIITLYSRDIDQSFKRNIDAANHKVVLEEIKRIEPHQPKTTLDVHLCANGSNHGTIEHLEKESEKWVEQIKSSFLYR